MGKNSRRKTANHFLGILLGLLLYCGPHHCFGSLGSEAEYRDCVLEIARSQVGETEVGGNNKGPAVAKYCATLNLGEGYPWCACFVKWVFEVVGIPTPGGNAWSPSWFPSDRIVHKRGINDHKTIERVKHGDLASLFYQKLGRIGHVMIVIKMDEKWAETIDGNTNFAGARDSETGDGVHIKKRPSKTIYKVSSWIPKETSNEFSFML